MKKKLLAVLATGIVTFSMVATASALSITAMSANDLAESLLGSGITISDVSYTGATGASGYFEGGAAAGIGIESGIVLTTGAASNLNGTTNTSDGITGNNGVGGTSYLDALIPGYSTNDATVLEFDFVSSGDAAYFSYAFGSEEYNEWVASPFNDVFGFFLDGTAVGDNVATLDDGTVVAINNINNTYNSDYYNDNDLSDLGTPTPFNFEYDGFTNVLVASMQGLTVGETYHLTLAIADAGDYILDSGVFLGAGTFSDVDPTQPVPEPSTILLMGTGLLGLIGYTRKRFSKKS